MINNTIKINTSTLIMIDIQEKLVPIMSSYENLIKNNYILLQAAKELGVTTIISEQYPKGLGHTIDPLSEFVTEDNVLQKNSFSLYPPYKDTFDELIKSEKNQFIISGIETHICVYQTAKDLLHAGAEVFMISDAVSSRKEEHKHQVLHTLLHMGANVLPTESILFELLKDTSHPSFKFISNLIK